LGTVTYSEPAVVEAIDQRFIPFQVNVTEPSSQTLIERFHQIWTPDLRVLGADGYEYDRWNGYLPPFEFLPRLLVAEAQALLRQNDNAGAAALYANVLERFPTSAVAPEAAYYVAVAAYKASHRPDDLLGNWEHLRSRYPTSIWRVKQSFSEPPPAAAASKAA
jgi:hypothetical protein